MVDDDLADAEFKQAAFALYTQANDVETSGTSGECSLWYRDKRNAEYDVDLLQGYFSDVQLKGFVPPLDGQFLITIPDVTKDQLRCFCTEMEEVEAQNVQKDEGHQSSARHKVGNVVYLSGPEASSREI